MAEGDFINILIAEDNEVSREMMAGVMRAQGYRVYGAVDGGSAIKVVEDRMIDLAIVDINMAPIGGFDFIRHLVVKGMDIPVVIVTGDESSHILVEATALGVSQVIQKPVDAEKLAQLTHRILRRKGLNPRPLAVAAHDTKFSPAEIMKKAIALAEKNAKARNGGPFAAIVVDNEGRILGEGVSGAASRADPTAHAEVMAIRRAASLLGRSDLSDCVLYCSSEPTMIGKALIASVGVVKVYYGLGADEARSIHKDQQVKTEYTQLCHGEALEVYKNWRAQKDKAGG